MPRGTDARTASLLARLADHRPADPRESWALRRIRALVAWLPAPFDQHADATHVTAGAVAVDPSGRVLLHRHRRLGTWLQPGGHVEGSESPRAAALRELAEETGLGGAVGTTGAPELLHVDVHEGPRGHVHLDLRYLVAASAAVPAPEPGESRQVAWLDVDEAIALADGSAAAAIRRAGARGRR